MTATNTASEAQLKFISDLIGKKIEHPSELGTKLGLRLADLFAKGEMTKAKASEIIQWLLAREDIAQPYVSRVGEDENAVITRPGETPPTFKVYDNVPDGRYAIEVEGDELNPIHFYTVKASVKENKWKGFQNVKRHVSDDRINLRGPERTYVLRRISEDPRAAAIRFGHETGSCCLCGRELTRAESREAGIGPVCAGKEGW